jgi:hypothetical protein
MVRQKDRARTHTRTSNWIEPTTGNFFPSDVTRGKRNLMKIIKNVDDFHIISYIAFVILRNNENERKTTRNKKTNDDIVKEVV